MVAVSGVGWRLAPSLVAYVDEADRVFPDRDTSTDGSIGDLAHASRTSDHNPFDGWVHAVDLDEDLAAGLDLKAFAEHLRERRDERVRYVIYEGRIFKSYASSAGPAWTWLPYTGPSPHEGHLHLSIERTDAARTDLRPWGFGSEPLEEDMTPEQAATLDRIHWMLEQTKPNADRVPAVQASVDLLAWGVLDPGQGLRTMVAELAGRPVATIDAATIAAAIPANLAQQVADELAKRLTG